MKNLKFSYSSQILRFAQEDKSLNASAIIIVDIIRVMSSAYGISNGIVFTGMTG